MGTPAVDAQQYFVSALAFSLSAWIRCHSGKAGQPPRGLLAKIVAPMCLSWHPGTPLTVEEVLETMK
jgi:hypothetical protein